MPNAPRVTPIPSLVIEHHHILLLMDKAVHSCQLKLQFDQHINEIYSL